MNTIRNIIGFLIIVYFLASCTVYIPQSASIPLFSEKQELQASAGVTMLMGGNVSVAYAPANHLGTQLFASIHPDNSTYIQGVLGFWNKGLKNVNFEAYGGLASGHNVNSINDVNSNLDANYLLYFAQFNVGQTNLGTAHIDYGFGLKTGLFDANVTYLDENLDVRQKRSSPILVEPQAFLRLGGENLKAGFQINTCRIINQSNEEHHLFYLPFIMGVSLNYHLKLKSK